LLGLLVNPNNNPIGGSGTTRQLTNVGYATYPFQYWRGSLIYTFEVICSPFHRGQLRIEWSPSVPDNAEDTTNTVHNCVLDVKSGTKIDVHVAWAQREPWKPTTISSGASGAATTDSNGMLYVKVANPLTCPLATQSIQVNVYVRAGEDYEVAVLASNNKMNLVHYTPYDVAVTSDYTNNNFGYLTTPSAGPSITYQSKMTTFGQNMDIDNTICHINGVAFDAKVSELTIGEKIKSFRPLLKRYVLNRQVSFVDNYITINVLPPFPKPTENIANLIGYANQTLQHYLIPSFAGVRGGTRYKMSFANYYTTENGHYDELASAMQFHACYTNDSAYNATQALTQVVPTSLLEFQTCYGKTSQGAVLLAPGDGILEFEVPSYSPTQFYVPTSRLYTNGALGLPGVGVINMRGVVVPDTSYQQLCHVYTASTEDFNLIYYLGPPLMYLWRAATPPA
jgi:hypothetical protein